MRTRSSRSSRVRVSSVRACSTALVTSSEPIRTSCSPAGFGNDQAAARASMKRRAARRWRGCGAGDPGGLRPPVDLVVGSASPGALGDGDRPGPGRTGTGWRRRPTGRRRWPPWTTSSSRSSTSSSPGPPPSMRRPARRRPRSRPLHRPGDAAALDQPVGVAQQRPPAPRPPSPPPARGSAGRRCRARARGDLETSTRPPGQQRRGMAGQGDGEPAAVGADPAAADGGEHLLGLPVAGQTLSSRRAGRRGVAGEHQRPPGGAQGHPDRGLDRAVPGHVPDQQGHGPVGQLRASKKSAPSSARSWPGR
jgi:hypothetical protein